MTAVRTSDMRHACALCTAAGSLRAGCRCTAFTCCNASTAATLGYLVVPHRFSVHTGDTESSTSCVLRRAFNFQDSTFNWGACHPAVERQQRRTRLGAEQNRFL